jgi:hypothetical protein
MSKQSAPKGPPLRDSQLSCYVTEDDAQIVKDFAKKIGFRSTSHLMTAIVERLVIGGFSPMVFLKVGMQIQDFAKANGAPYRGKTYWGVRPLPALPDQHISAKQFDKEIAEIRRELFEDGDEVTSPT